MWLEKSILQALMRNRRSRRQQQRRVEEWLQTPDTPEPSQPRRQPLGYREEREHANTRTGDSRTGEASSQQPMAPSARAPPSAITYRRDHTEPRQLYVSINVLQGLVAEQQISQAAASAAATEAGLSMPIAVRKNIAVIWLFYVVFIYSNYFLCFSLLLQNLILLLTMKLCV